MSRMRRKREVQGRKAEGGRKDEQELDLRRDFLGLSRLVSSHRVVSRRFHVVSFERCLEGLAADA